MNRKTIWVNCLVINEENFLWFAINSVIEYVDKILLWDSGSTDKTVEIINLLQKKFGKKIDFREVGKVTPSEFTKVRQEMLDQTKSDWLLIVDGDEVWWESSIKKVIETIQKKGEELDSIVVPFYNCLGDIYHYQDTLAGKYHIDEKTGHLTVKAINTKISGLHVDMPYGQEGFFDQQNTLIQNRVDSRRIFLKAPFLHLTHLRRTSENNPKFKYEIGKTFPADFKFPEFFYDKNIPNFIPSPFVRRNNLFKLGSAIFEVPRKVKRKIYG